jgi:hypothetical protein
MEKTVKTILSEAAKRNLPFLLIGGNAVIVYGHPRTTIDLDLLIPEIMRSAWLDTLRELGFRFHHGTDAFVQLEPGSAEFSPVDLMFVDARTWELLARAPQHHEILGQKAALPRPEHLVALKLHAARSLARSKPETDWEDIRQLVRLQRLDWRDPEFQALILRFGGEAALDRIKSFAHDQDRR